MRIKRKIGDSIPLGIVDVTGFDGLPVADLSTWFLWFTIKSSEDDPDPGLLQKTTGNGITAQGAAAWWQVSHTESRSLFQPGVTYTWDLQGRDPAGRIATLDEGKFILTNDNTKSS